MRSALLSLAFLAFSFAAQADLVLDHSIKDWETADEVDAVLQVPVCRAYTVKSDSTEPVELSLSYPKDGKSLPMLRVVTRVEVPMIEVHVARGVDEPIFLIQAPATSADSGVYWYAPVNFPRLESLIREARSLELTMDPKGQPYKVVVSLAGSSNALNQTYACLNGVKVPTEFLKQLNATKDNLTPDLGDRSPAFLKKAVDAAFTAYLAGVDVEKALEVLQKPYAKLIRQESAAKQQISANQKALTEMQAALDKLNQDIATWTAQLAKDQADLASFKTQKPLAEADLKTKKARYTQLLAQMAPYAKAIADATKAVAKIQASIDADQKLIASNTRKIADDRAEKDKLEDSLPRLQRNLNNATAEMNRAAAAYNSYDVDYEIRSRLSSDFSYNNAKRELESDQRDLGWAQDKQRRAEYDVSSRQRALDDCRRGEGNPSCSSEQSQLQFAQWDLDRARRDVDDKEREISNDQSDMDRARSSIVNDVQSHANDLAYAYNNARSDWENAKAALSRTKNRIAAIPGEIAKLQAAIDRATAEIPVLQTQLATAQANQASAQSSYDQFAQSIGFDVAAAEYQAAQALVDAITKSIRDLGKEIPALQSNLKNGQAALPRAQRHVQTATDELAKSQQRLVPIQEQLKPYYDQAAPLLAQQAALVAEFQTDRAIYQDLFKLLSGM